MSICNSVYHSTFRLRNFRIVLLRASLRTNSCVTSILVQMVLWFPPMRWRRHKVVRGSKKLIPTPILHTIPCKTAFELEVNKKPSVGGKIFFFSISQEICSERKKLHDSAFSYVSARVNNSEPRSKFVGCGQLFSWNKKFQCLNSLHVLVNWLRRRNDESFWSWRA